MEKTQSSYLCRGRLNEAGLKEGDADNCGTNRFRINIYSIFIIFQSLYFKLCLHSVIILNKTWKSNKNLLMFKRVAIFTEAPVYQYILKSCE